MAGELILLTGSTGHLGYRTLVEALRAGYRVRAAVRRASSITEIKATSSVQPYHSNLSFIIVEDITQDGAFDSALKDVDYIVHMASPLAKPSEDLEATIVQPAIRGTVSILYSALKQPSIKRVVITSSAAAVIPLEVHAGHDVGIISPESKVTIHSTGSYPNYFAAYAISKILAYNRTLDFIRDEKPKFTVHNIMPTFVIGANLLATTPETVNAGSNALALGVLLGEKNPAGLMSTTVHVDDVAYVHIAALDPKIEGNQNFGVNSNGVDGIQWDDAIDIVKKHFPKEVEKGVFPLGGSQKSNLVKFDATRTEEVFGFKFKSFEEQIKSLAGLYAEVSARGDRKQ